MTHNILLPTTNYTVGQMFFEGTKIKITKVSNVATQNIELKNQCHFVVVGEWKSLVKTNWEKQSKCQVITRVHSDNFFLKSN